MRFDQFLTNPALADTVMGMVVRGVAAAILVIVCIWLFWKVVYGVFCTKLAHKKGYKGYFCTGFFWGKIGLNYVGNLPDLKLNKAVEKLDVPHDAHVAAPHAAENAVHSDAASL